MATGPAAAALAPRTVRRGPRGSGRMLACHVLIEEPAIAGALSGQRLVAAQRACVASAISLPRRRAEPSELGLIQAALGLLVIEGMLVRRVCCAGLQAAELLGPGDLIRPHQADRSVPKLQIDSSWQVIEPVRLVVLDLEFAKRSAPFPEVGAMLTSRLIEHSHSLITQMAIVQSRRVSERLLKLLWYQASRWGTIGAWGATMELRCTHSILAELVAATRPSVTLALRQLESARLLSHEDDTWFLHRPPPMSLA
jgi:CRP/FNR family cyclic AMP-dependent transcriptional regulator